MTLRTLLGIEHPIIQAPMAGVQGSALAIAVSNAGGLGSLPCALLRPVAMRDELERIRAATTKPYNVNFFCHQPPVPDATRDAAWKAAMAPYYRELAIDLAAIPAEAGRAPFSDEAADVLSEFKPAVVSFHFGLPSPELLARVRTWGARILSSATTVDEARWLEAHGVDAVIAQGLEAGGHRGMFLSDNVAIQVGTMALLPQIVKAVNVPVIAAGGIVDANTVAAAFALGAAGVQAGTAYLLCPEADERRAPRGAEGWRPGTPRSRSVQRRPARASNRIRDRLGPMRRSPRRFAGGRVSLAAHEGPRASAREIFPPSGRDRTPPDARKSPLPS
jgi:nitronate monooxygenase